MYVGVMAAAVSMTPARSFESHVDKADLELECNGLRALSAGTEVLKILKQCEMQIRTQNKKHITTCSKYALKYPVKCV